MMAIFLSVERIATTLTVLIIWCVFAEPTKEELLADVPVNPILTDNIPGKLDPRVIKVTEGLYMAIDFGLANSILIEAPDGAIVVDVTESMESGARAFAALRKVSESPIKAIIYTHNHADHVFGAKAYLEDPDNPPEVWGYKTVIQKLDRSNMISRIGFKRAMRQFGVMLEKQACARTGLCLNFDINSGIGILYPDHFLDDEEEDVIIAGLDLKLVHIPGETDDQIGVWIPSMKAFLCADDVYKAFPNLYAIRGTPSRDLMQWAYSIDKIRSLRPEFLVPSHTEAVTDKEEIYNLLTIYRDAIQFVHDQTVRYMNRGYGPADISRMVHLPSHAAQHPFLQEIYGTVEWSVKNTYTSYMGWFNGDPIQLSPITPKERAQKMIELVGGVGALTEAAKQAMERGEARWALELASYVFILNPDEEEARKVRLEALKSLAAEQTSANGRNYYLTIALEDYNLIELNQRRFRVESVENIRTKTLLKMTATQLNPEKVEGISMTVVLKFTDTDENYTCVLRNSILDVADGLAEKWDLMITTTTTTWSSIISQERNPVVAYMSGDFAVDGGIETLLQFISYIDL